MTNVKANIYGYVNWNTPPITPELPISSIAVTLYTFYRIFINALV